MGTGANVTNLARVSGDPNHTPIANDPLPSGTVTFAFTDIEGSTQHWERDPDAMQAARKRHDAIIRTAVAERGGRVFKTVGDAFCIAFSRAQDAAAAMISAQHAFVAEEHSAAQGFRTRAAIHTGTTDERDGDYFGPTLNRLARLLAIGHGGQILVSSAAAELLQDQMARSTLRNLGEHRLKDLARAERVYQLLAPGLATEFPPLRSLRALLNNLPVQLTSFVARESEVAEIAALMGKHRLVSIVGSGGVGKTRTSLQVSANLVDDFRDGVWFIELAPLSSGEYIPTAIAQAIGLTLGSAGTPLDILVASLKSKSALLIIDNCEHLIESAARTVSALLHACPQLFILTSSRQRLGIAGETVYRMPSLRTAEAGVSLTAAQAARVPALMLLVERAAAFGDRFTLTNHNALEIAQICRRLDGIALAIELAAARLNMLSPRQLRESLDQRFRVLTGGNRDVLPRHQTLRALIDWSYDLLDDRERALFRRLGVFVNGFGFEGAVAVGTAAGLDELSVLDGLASLVDKSLVLAEVDGDKIRYRMLESTRAYARDRLEAEGELSASIACHLRYLRDVFTSSKKHADHTGRFTEIDALVVAELDDVRAALDGVSTIGEVKTAAELLVAIDSKWDLIGLGGEGSSHLARLISCLPDDERRLKSRLWNAIALLADRRDITRNLEAAFTAVALAREAIDPDVLAQALITYARSLARSRKFENAAAALSEAEALAATRGVALHLNIVRTRAFLNYLLGDLDAAAEGYRQLHETHLRLGNAAEANGAASNLAENEYGRGKTETAVVTLAEVIPRLRAGRDRPTLLMTLGNLCGYLIALDRLSEAHAVVREALRTSTPYDREGYQVTIVIEHASLILALESDVPHAALLAGYTEAAFDRLGYRREHNEQTTRTRLLKILNERLAPAEFATLLSQGATLASEAAMALVPASLAQQHDESRLL